MSKPLLVSITLGGFFAVSMCFSFQYNVLFGNDFLVSGVPCEVRSFLSKFKFFRRLGGSTINFAYYGLNWTSINTNTTQ